MFLLAIDTSTPVISVALTRDGAIVATREVGALDGQQLHGELLAPAIRDVMQGYAFTDLDGVAAGLGPGPYTGLRVGLVTAATIAHVHGLPVFGVSSLDAIAFGARLAGVEGECVATIDVKRKELGYAVYREESNHPFSGPAIAKVLDLATEQAQYVGSGIFTWASMFDELAYAQPPAAAHVGLLAEVRAAAGEDQPMVPLYLRHPDVTPPKVT